MAQRPARARPDGYWDYEPAHIAAGYLTDPARRAALERGSDNYIRNPTGQFPAAERLRAAVAGLPAITAVIIVFPPTYRSLLPAPGSPGDEDNRACKAALAEALAGRANAAVVDWRRDRRNCTTRVFSLTGRTIGRSLHGQSSEKWRQGWRRACRWFQETKRKRCRSGLQKTPLPVGAFAPEGWTIAPSNAWSRPRLAAAVRGPCGRTPGFAKKVERPLSNGSRM